MLPAGLASRPAKSGSVPALLARRIERVRETLAELGMDADSVYLEEEEPLL